MGQIRYGLAMSLMLLFFHEIVRSHIKKAFFFFFSGCSFSLFCSYSASGTAVEKTRIYQKTGAVSVLCFL